MPPKRIIVLCLLWICLVPRSSAEEIAAEGPTQPGRQSAKPQDLIKSAYVKSRKAKNPRDYSEIVYLLELRAAKRIADAVASEIRRRSERLVA